MSSIFLLDRDDSLVELSETQYSSEELLQQLLAKYPAILAGDAAGGDPRRFVLVEREMPIPDSEAGAGRWSMDHLLLDQDAVPTFVETKRSTDTRIRREVVGQMLDYAANGLVYWPADAIRTRFEATHGANAESVIQGLLGPEETPEEFWKHVSDNLRAGQIRLVFVADRLPVELQRIIEFLNEQMNPAEVIGIEVRQFVGGDVRSLVPRVIGQTARAQATKNTPSRDARDWDHDSFVAEFSARKGTDVADIATRIIDWAAGQPAVVCDFGHGKSARVRILVTDQSLDWYVALIEADGRLYLPYEYLRKRAPFDSEALLKEYRDRLNRIPGISLTEKPSWPSVSLSSFSSDEALTGLFQVILWVSDIVRAEVQHAAGTLPSNPPSTTPL
jgi:hypothetical protein